MRRILAAAVALAPLSMACAAFAQDSITGNVTGPVVTATSDGAAKTVTVNSGALVTPGTSASVTLPNCAPAPAGCAVGIFINDSAVVTNSGTVGNNSLTTTGNATAILAQGLAAAPTKAGGIANELSISLGNGYTPPTNTTTGITYGAWSTTQNNYGIRLIAGSGTFYGGILNDTSGSITVNGANSYGVSIEGALDGTNSAHTQATIANGVTPTAGAARPIALDLLGSISVTGDYSRAVNIAGAVTGDVVVRGSINATGYGAQALTTGGASGDINGRLTIGSAVSATGFHYTSRPSDPTINNFNDPKQATGYSVAVAGGGTVNSEYLIGGPAVAIGGNVTGGLLLDSAPTTSTTNTDADGNGIADTSQTTGSIAAYGSAPALQIGSMARDVTIGTVGTTNTTTTTVNGATVSYAQLYDYGVMLNGTVLASGVYDGINATAIQLGVSGSTHATTITGGIAVGATVSASAYAANATAIQVNSGVNLPAGVVAGGSGGGITNAGGTIEATVASSSLPTTSAAQIASEAAEQAIGIQINTGANVPTINNRLNSLATGGIITAQIAGAYGNATAIQDKSGSLTTINNSGQILALTDTAPGTTPLDEQPTTHYDANNYCITGSGGCAIAIDARGTAASTGLTINQTLQNVAGAVGSNVSIQGDVYLPNQNSAAVSNLNILTGSVVGVVNYGTGTVNVTLDGGGIIRGPMFYAGNNLNLTIVKGIFDDGVIDQRSPTASRLNLASLTVSKQGVLYANIDPNTPANSGYNVSGAATFNSTTTAGSQTILAVNFSSLVPLSTVANPTYTYQFLQAGSLNITGAISQTVVTSPTTGQALTTVQAENHPFLFNVAIGNPNGTVANYVANALGLNNPAPGAANGLTYIPASTGCTVTEICVQAAVKTAQQAGMNAAESSAYPGAYAALGGSDSDLRDVFLSKTSRTDFFRDYDQLLPTSAGATLLSLSASLATVSRALADTRPMAEAGEVTGWAQELNYYTDKTGVNAQGFRSHGSGFAAGVERGTAIGAFGVSTTFATGDMKSPDQLGTSDLSSAQYEVGGYWRFQHAGWRAWARAAGGYVTFNSTREFIDNPVVPNTIVTVTPTSTTSSTGVTTTTNSTTTTAAPLFTRTATASWSGYSASAGAGVSYEQHFWRRYFVRPEASVEYLYLHEGAYTEQSPTVGANGILLAVDSRAGHLLTSKAMLNLGARYGDQGQGGFTAELHAGYKDNIDADAGATYLRFLSDSTAKKYAVLSDSLTGGGPVLGFRLMAGGPMGYVALEGDAEDMDHYMTYLLLLRAAFRF